MIACFFKLANVKITIPIAVIFMHCFENVEWYKFLGGDLQQIKSFTMYLFFGSAVKHQEIYPRT